ncbi:MAG TPA: hypothetical protein ENK02_00870, partial [Planctomycetes bacterium]|nr:hypothetical protein [Planctomycetota bacterium]
MNRFPVASLSLLVLLLAPLFVSPVLAQRRFQEFPRFPLFVAKYGQLSLGSGDFDGDGDQDIVLGRIGVLQSHQLLFNDGFGKFTNVTKTHFPGDKDVTGFAVLVDDFDQDGDLDIIFGTSFWSTNKRYQFLFYINDGKGHFKNEGNFRFPLDPICPDTRSMAKGDFDGDGDVDFVVGNFRFFKNGLLFYENITKGFFLDTTVRKKRIPRTRSEIMDIVPSDLDRDGDLDLVV